MNRSGAAGNPGTLRAPSRPTALQESSMPRIPRSVDRGTAATTASAPTLRLRWQQQIGFGLVAAGALLWLGQWSHHLAAS